MKKSSVFVLLVLFSICVAGQNEESWGNATEEGKRGYFRAMFYNTENLFDVYDDTLKSDEQFLPDGDKHWTSNKYNDKLSNICKVIIAVGQWDPPDIVGLCEVENRMCLEDLLIKTPLHNLKYQIVHHESPDNRGIDVALLYRKDRFVVLNEKAIRVVFPFDANKPTRDILYVKGETSMHDTLHVFVNHWPSRWGGQMETEEKRVYVAEFLRSKVDSIFNTDKDANILIMGDLNDHADNKSLTDGLKANREFDRIKPQELYNLTYHLEESKGMGTHKYDGHWGVLDHIIVSGNLMLGKSGLVSKVEDAHILNADFLLEKDEQNVGFRPFRTYIGFKFHGGFSDHLPVFLDINRN